MVDKTNKTKPNVVGKPSLLIFKKNNIDTVNKTDKSQSSDKTVDPSKKNKTETV